NGEKSISEAVKDTAVGTVKDGAKNYVKGYGAELAEQGVKTLITYTEKEVKNKLARNVLVGGLNKIANADILMRGAGAIIDVGHSIKRLMNGEITKTEFLYEIGEKAAGYCSASVFGFIGMSMGGPLGAAVGEVVCSLVGYFANKILYRAVLPAMEEARQARQRYEVYHEFCEYSIKQMEKQRQEFIKVTTRLFAHRQAVIDDTFRRYDAALEHNNYEEINSALGALVEEFGMDWKYQTMDDVKRNLNDENFVLEL
ncbi:MAG: hypothetical protein IJ824_05700, partial [Alphaproteobacteria bacterium]|nr:hypothetical protein [Alphaproteobacteria bacterium]